MQQSESKEAPGSSWLDRKPSARKGGRPTTEQRNQDVHGRAMDRFDRIQASLRDSRLQCLQDRRFYSVAGAQWEGPLQNQFANKPRFEANLIQLAVIRIFNEYRNNRIAVDFVPKDGSPDSKLADTCAGLYRADEQDSVAEEAHDNAFDEGVGGGFGAWRLRAVYEDEDNPDDYRQRIYIEPIYDADSSVFFDLNAKRQDKSDSKYCFVLSSLTQQEFIDEWGQDPASWPKTIHQYEFDWATPNVVYVCEYYEVERKVEKIYVYKNLDGTTEEYNEQDFKEDEGLRERLDAIGSVQIEEKKLRTRKVHKWIMSGNGVLEDCGYIPGKCIPIVPFYGKRWFVDNVERCSGVVRLPKDMQRLLNMQLSKLGEIAALSTVEKPIFTPEQIVGNELLWSEDNIVNNPYLLVNPVKGPNGEKVATGPIGYTKPPQIPPALGACLEVTTQIIRELLGNQQEAEKIAPNISGKVVELIQSRIDMQAFIYMSNMAKSVKREGEIWLSMAKDLLTKEGRRMKSMTPQGKPSSVVIRNPVLVDGAKVLENDLSRADFDVYASVGPSSQSKKAATVRALTGMAAITDNPQDREILVGTALMNMEGEGLSDIAEFYRRKMVRAGVVKPTDEEKGQLKLEIENTPPSPEQELLNAAASEARAKAAKANADTINVLADADLKTAKTAETYAGIDESEQRTAIDAAQALANLNVEDARARVDNGEAQP